MLFRYSTRDVFSCFSITHFNTPPQKKTRGKVSRSKNRSTPPPLPIPNKLTSWQLISATCCWLYMGQMIIIWCVDIQNSSTLQMSVVNVECFPLSWWLQTYCKTFIEYIHTHIPPPVLILFYPSMFLLKVQIEPKQIAFQAPRLERRDAEVLRKCRVKIGSIGRWFVSTRGILIIQYRGPP